ncbi:MAG: hypothetical protein ACLFSQ_07045 [Candidatus Zixiibacteriota bacterium]
MKRFYLAFILFLVCFAFSLDVIEDEADIDNYFQDGFLDYQASQDLRRLYYEKIDINSNNLEGLSLIPGIERIDIAKIKDIRKQNGGSFKNIEQFKKLFGENSKYLDSFIEIVEKKTKKYRVGFDIYNNTHISDIADIPYSSGRFYFEASKLRFDLSMRNQPSEYSSDIDIRSRSVYLEHKKHLIILGNYRKGFGNELIFGRNAYLPSSKKHLEKPAKHLLYPSNGINNGIYWKREGNLSPGLALNYLDYDSLSINAMAINGSYAPDSNLTVGLVYTNGSIKDKTADEEFRQMAFSAFSRYYADEWFLEAGAAIIEKYPGFNLAYRFSKDSIGLEIGSWAYHQDFAPIFSNGISAKKAFTEIERTEYFKQKSYQAGQLGIDLSLNYPIFNDITMEFGQQYYYNRSTEENCLRIRPEIEFVNFIFESRVNLFFEWENETQDNSNYESFRMRLAVDKDFHDNLSIDYNLDLENTSKSLTEFDYIRDNEYPEVIEIEKTDRRWRFSTDFGQEVQIMDEISLKFSQKYYKYNLEKTDNGYLELNAQQIIDTNDIDFKFEILYRNYFDPEDEPFWGVKIKLGFDYNFVD